MFPDTMSLPLDQRRCINTISRHVYMLSIWLCTLKTFILFVCLILYVSVNNSYAPHVGTVKGAYCFRLVRPCVRASVRASVRVSVTNFITCKIHFWNFIYGFLIKK